MIVRRGSGSGPTKSESVRSAPAAQRINGLRLNASSRPRTGSKEPCRMPSKRPSSRRLLSTLLTLTPTVLGKAEVLPDRRKVGSRFARWRT
jgi:hypothetical protein